MLNEAGKLRHRKHVLIFRLGVTRDQDTLLAHLVGRRGPLLTASGRRKWRRHYMAVQRHFLRNNDVPQDVLVWKTDEARWREVGWDGRPEDGNWIRPSVPGGAPVPRRFTTQESEGRA